MPVSSADATRIAPFLLQLEDRRFYKHSGVDWPSLARAFLINLRGGRILQGGSTISMQLARNTLIEASRSLLRKSIEIALAKKMEAHFSKEEILRLYCEQVFMGKGLRGFQAAAFFIYRKPIEKLNDKEIFGLLGMLRAPEHFSPYKSPETYCRRQKFVTGLLASNTNVVVKPPNPIHVKLRTCARLVRAINRDVSKNSRWGVSAIKKAGVALETRLQKRADSLVCEASMQARVSFASTIVIDNATGHLLAESSWQNGKEMEFSPALEGRIQPGSTFKTFALIAAIEQGYGLNLNLLSAPLRSTEIKGVDGNPWTVHNYNHVYHGNISLLRAFIVSDNCAFARLVEMLDHEQLLTVYRRFGLLGESERAYPSVVLGGSATGVNMTNLALAYQAIANNGVLRGSPMLVRYVEHYNGGLSWTPLSSRIEKTIVNSETVAIVRFALRSAACSYGLPNLWAKSGTTNAGKLLAGFSDKLMVVVKLGKSIASDNDWRIDKSAPMLMRIINELSEG